MKNIYLLLAIVGGILPLAVFFGAFGLEPMPPAQHWLAALYANRGSGAAFTDLAIAAVAFWFWVFPECQRQGLRRPWIYVLITALIGLSCALPLFLYMRERARAAA